MRVCGVYKYICIHMYIHIYMYIYIMRVIILLFFFFFLENQRTKKKLIARFRIEPKRKHHSSWKRKKLIMIRRRRRWQTSTAIPCVCFFFRVRPTTRIIVGRQRLSLHFISVFAAHGVVVRAGFQLVHSYKRPSLITHTIRRTRLLRAFF